MTRPALSREEWERLAGEIEPPPSVRNVDEFALMLDGADFRALTLACRTMAALQDAKTERKVADAIDAEFTVAFDALAYARVALQTIRTLAEQTP